jgi:hypothetical protein
VFAMRKEKKIGKIKNLVVLSSSLECHDLCFL